MIGEGKSAAAQSLFRAPTLTLIYAWSMHTREIYPTTELMMLLCVNDELMQVSLWRRHPNNNQMLSIKSVWNERMNSIEWNPKRSAKGAEKREIKEKNLIAKQKEIRYTIYIYGAKNVWTKKRKPHQYGVVERNLFIHGDYIQLFALCEWQTCEKCHRRHRNGFVEGVDDNDNGKGGGSDCIESYKWGQWKLKWCAIETSKWFSKGTSKKCKWWQWRRWLCDGGYESDATRSTVFPVPSTPSIPNAKRFFSSRFIRTEKTARKSSATKLAAHRCGANKARPLKRCYTTNASTHRTTKC